MLTMVETIAAERGVDPASIAPLRIRPTVKPVTLAETAALESTEQNSSAAGHPGPDRPQNPRPSNKRKQHG